MLGVARGLVSSDGRSHKHVTGDVSRKHRFWMVGGPHGLL